MIISERCKHFNGPQLDMFSLLIGSIGSINIITMRVTQRLINNIVATPSATLAKHQHDIGSTSVHFYLAYLICLVVRALY